MPAHEVYNTLIDIWSRGCNPVLHYSLPILFAYEVSSFLLSALGIHRRCHYAIIKAEAEAAAWDQQLEAGLALERKKRAEDKAKFAALLAEKEEIGKHPSPDAERREEEEEREQDARDDEEARKGIGGLVDEDKKNTTV